MARIEDREDAVNALRRMIVYARDEAARLRITDAVLLLAYAEDVIVTRDPSRSDDCARQEEPDAPIVHH